MSVPPINPSPRFGAWLVGEPSIRQNRATVTFNLNAEEKAFYRDMTDTSLDRVTLVFQSKNARSPLLINGSNAGWREMHAIKHIILNNEKAFRGGIGTRLLKDFERLRPAKSI